MPRRGAPHIHLPCTHTPTMHPCIHAPTLHPSRCAACGQTTALLAQAYAALRARGKRLEMVLVPQETDEAGLDECRSAMPWPSLALGSGLPAYLGQRYGVTSIPTLVLLSRAGDLISTDGVRLLRRHGRAFPWTAMAPPQTPHLHPLCERLLRLGPVDPGQSHDLPKCKLRRPRTPRLQAGPQAGLLLTLCAPRLGQTNRSTSCSNLRPSPPWQRLWPPCASVTCSAPRPPYSPTRCATHPWLGLGLAPSSPPHHPYCTLL